MNDDNLLFIDDNKVKVKTKNSWKVLIVDDEEDIHEVTKFVLKNFEFEKKSLQFFSAYTIEGAKKIIKENPDIAIILLDIVMEEDDSGLKFVKYLRDELRNNIVRIILRTGQPGIILQTQVVIDYDINDYREKTELTREKFFSAIIMALRSFEVLKSLQNTLNELKSSCNSAQRFISQDYLKIFHKKSIEEIKLGDYSIQEMSVLFMDMSNLIVPKKQLTPQENLNLINSFIKYLDPIIKKQNGIIDTFFGNAIMILFYGSPDQVIKICIEMIRNVINSNENKINNYMPTIRIGIHSGLLTFGTVGSEDRMDYTAFGDTVHLTVELEKLNKHYHTSMLVSDEIIKKLSHPENFNYRWIANLVPHENLPSLAVYEIFDFSTESIIKMKQENKSLFEDALNEYLAHHHKNAMEKFNQVIIANPNDEVAKVYLQILSESRL